MEQIKPEYVFKKMQFIKFRRSANPLKKYDAILKNIVTGNIKKVGFGARGYEQYKDKTGLGLYTKYDHNDKERRRLYRIRHKRTHNKIFSPSWFSWHYLW